MKIAHLAVVVTWRGERVEHPCTAETLPLVVSWLTQLVPAGSTWTVEEVV